MSRFGDAAFVYMNKNRKAELSSDDLWKGLESERPLGGLGFESSSRAAAACNASPIACGSGSDMERYSTEAEAFAGHARFVKEYRDRVDAEMRPAGAAWHVEP